jgi:hypothetical protein
MIDTGRGESLALGKGAKMESLSGFFDGHPKRQMMALKIDPSFVSSIEELKIKLHFLNMERLLNGRRAFGLCVVSAVRSFSREAAFLRAPRI